MSKYAAYPIPLSQLVLTEINKFPAFRKVSQRAKKSFASDLAVVANLLRPGYLLDAFSLSDPSAVFSNLLERLSEENSVFLDIVHIYEPASGHSFFVHREPCLQFISRIIAAPRNRDHGLDSDGDSISCLDLQLQLPVYIHLKSGSSFRPTKQPPFQVQAILGFLEETFRSRLAHRTTSITLPTMNITTSVPLAAILLGYLVAYVPDMYDNHFLSQVPLDMYECVLQLDDAADDRGYYSLSRFSCPRQAATEFSMLDPENIIRILTDQYAERLHILRSSYPDFPFGFKVLHSTAVLDRLAL